jgi:serine/threonine-protein kinase
MENNPYKPPATNVELVETEPEVPVEIAKKIRNGWVAGLVSVGFTLVLVMVSFTGTSVLGIDAWALLDVAFMAGLTFGVYRKSRTCAILLLAFFVLNKILMWVESNTLAGMPLAVIFGWFYVQGVMGTFEYHRWMRDNPSTR